jgi:hypothetical protein
LVSVRPLPVVGCSDGGSRSDGPQFRVALLQASAFYSRFPTGCSLKIGYHTRFWVVSLSFGPAPGLLIRQAEAHPDQNQVRLEMFWAAPQPHCWAPCIRTRCLTAHFAGPSGSCTSAKSLPLASRVLEFVLSALIVCSCARHAACTHGAQGSRRALTAACWTL